MEKKKEFTLTFTGVVVLLFIGAHLCLVLLTVGDRDIRWAVRDLSLQRGHQNTEVA